jgi:hypothetical protein
VVVTDDQRVGWKAVMSSSSRSRRDALLSPSVAE